MKKITLFSLSCILLLFATMPIWAAFKVNKNLWLIANLGQDQDQEMIGSELVTLYTSTSVIGFRWRLPKHFSLTPTYEIKYEEDHLSPHLKKEISRITGLSLSKRLGKFNYVGDINVTARYKATDLTNKLNKQSNERTDETSLAIQLVPSYYWRWTFEFTTKDISKVFSQGGSEYTIPRIELYRKMSRKTSFALGYKQENQKNFDTAGNLSNTYKKDIPVIQFWRTFTDKLRGYGWVQQTYKYRREKTRFAHQETTTETRINAWYKITRRWELMAQYKVISAKEQRSSNREIITLELGHTWRLDTRILGYMYIKPIIGYEYTDYFYKEKDGKYYFTVRAWG